MDIKQLAVKYKNNKLNEEEVKYFSDKLNLNPFYIKNPSSWTIMESILRKVFWYINTDETINKLPNNWLDTFK